MEGGLSPEAIQPSFGLILAFKSLQAAVIMKESLWEIAGGQAWPGWGARDVRVRSEAPLRQNLMKTRFLELSLGLSVQLSVIISGGKGGWKRVELSHYHSLYRESDK